MAAWASSASGANPLDVTTTSASSDVFLPGPTRHSFREICDLNPRYNAYPSIPTTDLRGRPNPFDADSIIGKKRGCRLAQVFAKPGQNRQSGGRCHRTKARLLVNRRRANTGQDCKPIVRRQKKPPTPRCPPWPWDYAADVLSGSGTPTTTARCRAVCAERKASSRAAPAVITPGRVHPEILLRFPTAPVATSTAQL